jgi:hypothetical protein
MWIASSLSVSPRTYSFESSGQGTHEDLSLHADGVELANMLRWIEWGDEPAQVILCDACGTIRCASGNYVALRRLDRFVVMAPAERAYAPSADGSAKSEYAEPAFIRRRGVPLIPADAWERVRGEGAPLPPHHRIRPLRWTEALLAAQIEAPHRLLGQPGERPGTRLSARVVATDPWIDPETLDRLGDLDMWGTTGENGAAQVVGEAKPVSLILDDGSLEEVALFAKVGEGYGLRFEPGLVLTPST